MRKRSEEQKREIRNAVIANLKALIVPGIVALIITGFIVFVVNYTKGTNVNNIKMVSVPTDANTTALTVKAGLASGSAPGKMTIYLNRSSESNLIITGGFLKYSYCVGTCSGNDFAQHTGTVTSTNPTVIATNLVLGSTQENYNIYLWIDNSMDTNNITGLSFTGYISADAIQTE